MIWSPPPPQLNLPPGQAHIFRLRLDLPEDRLTALHTWLDDDERHRAGRYHFDRDRRKFIAAHGQVRQILADILALDPEAIRFDHNPYGKPALSGKTDLHFNLTHSRGLGLLGLCTGQELGIDLEVEQREVEIEAIARRFFAPGEVERLLALPAGLRRAAFFNCWTRKEAYIKGRGQGLSIPLDAFEVSLVPGEPPQLFERLPERLPSPDWSLYDIYPGPGYTGALAVQGSPVSLSCWDWPV